MVPRIAMIKLAKQVFLCTKGITRISGWSKELAFAFLAACHNGNLALKSQDDEVMKLRSAMARTVCHNLRVVPLLKSCGQVRQLSRTG